MLRRWRLLLLVCAAHSGSAQVLVLDTFDAGTATGSIRSGTSWVGNVTQDATTLAVGGLAKNDNGWGVTGLSLDATSANSLFVVARRDAGHLAPSLFIQFEDNSLNTRILSIDASLFPLGQFTTMQVAVDAWPSDFAYSSITGWSLGGGGLGTMDFRMTFDHLELSPSAIPEPAGIALLAGIGALALTVWFRRRS